MIATAAWIALLLACVAIEIRARRAGSRTSTLGQLAARLASRRGGLILLWALWVFVGVHLFTRYTIPH